MYQTLTFYHSIIRWLVLASLCYAIYRACKGYFKGAPFTETDNAVRHWTATIAHIQLIIGIIFYVESPLVRYSLGNFKDAASSISSAFFCLIHPLLMLAAIVIITIGSALAKRRPSDDHKFKTMLTWYAAALVIIFIAIPWPFSPLASRPYLR